MPRIPLHLIDVEHTQAISLNSLMKATSEPQSQLAVRTPIVVVPNGGRYKLLRGLRKFLAAQVHGDADIAATIRSAENG